MKKIIIFLFALLFAVMTAFTQAPQKMSYQAVVRNVNNSLVADHNISARISLLQGSADGTTVYTEIHSTKTNANGLMTIELGEGQVQFGEFSKIDWSAGTFFLKTEVDPDGGINYSIISTQQLLSVPYALYANKAGNGFSGDFNDLTNKPEIPNVPTNVSAFANDKGYITQENDPTVPSWAKASTKPTYNYSEIQNTPTLADVATSGNYNDLNNKPKIPNVPTNVSAFANDKGYITQETDPKVPNWAKQPNKPSYTWNEISNKPTLFDGDYNSLSNKPTIPEAANNAKLTIKQNGQILNTFTANSAEDKEINIAITPDGLGDVLATSTSASNKQIKNLADPTDNQDAVTLSYLNAQLESLENAIEALQNVVNPTAAAPTVTTGTCSQTANGTLSFSGYLANTGNATITDMGFVYGTSANPTTSDTKVTVTPLSAIGSFTAIKSNITNGTYHIRAYATNSVGTAYGSDVTVTVETLTGITDVKYSINDGQSWYTANATSPNADCVDSDDGTMYYVKTTTPNVQDGRFRIKIKSDSLPDSIGFNGYNTLTHTYLTSTDEYKTIPFESGQDDTYRGIYLVSTTPDNDGYYEYEFIYWDGDRFVSMALNHKITINL